MLPLLKKADIIIRARSYVGAPLCARAIRWPSTHQSRRGAERLKNASKHSALMPTPTRVRNRR